MATVTILVVDPDPLVGALLADILKEEGYMVEIAESLKQATTLLSKSSYDLVITESFGQANLFDFDPAFLGALRSAAADTPIVVSSIHPASDVLRAGDFDLAEVVPKPFDIDELRDKVNRVLRNVVTL